MQFPNAAKGVSKIYTAEILALIASAVALVGAIVALIGVGAASGGSLAIGGILVIASSVVMIISFIMNIVGVGNASKDEDSFKRAMIAIIVGIIASILASAFSANTVIADIANAVSKVCELLVTLFCIIGIGNLAVKLGNSAVKAKADNLLKLILAVQVISLICSIVAVIFTSKSMTVVAGILALAAAVCSIIVYILYLSLLSKGKKMLGA